MEELERQRQALEEDADRKVRQVMREMEAQQRVALQQQKTSLERDHAKALAFVKAEGQQTLELGVRPDARQQLALRTKEPSSPPPRSVAHALTRQLRECAHTRAIFD